MIKFLPIALLLFACVKESNCTVTEVMTVSEIRVDSTYVQREYIVQLECY